MPFRFVVRILLDTNLIIDREGQAIDTPGLPSLLGLLSEHSAKCVIHPITRVEISSDPNEDRRKVVLRKLDAYPELETPAEPTKGFRLQSGEGPRSNDQRDSHLLYAVYANAVDFLITEDQRLISRGLRVGLADRILDVETGAVLFSQFFGISLPPLPQYLRHGPINGTWIDDPFFDSFKEEYAEFAEWFADKAREGRKCVWVDGPTGHLHALMIYKNENEPIDGMP